MMRVLPLLLLAGLAYAGEMKIEVTDGAGKPLWARIEVRGAGGKMFQPAGALRDKTAHVKTSGEPWYLGHFVSEGKAVLDVPDGDYTVVIEHGPEFERSESKVHVGAGAPAAIRAVLHPWIRMNEMGWWSGDTHVHRPLGDVPALMAAEELNVAVSYTMWNTANGSRNDWTDKPAPPETVQTVGPGRLNMIMNAEDERGGGAWMLLGLPGPFDMKAAGEWYPQGLKFVERARLLKKPGSVLPWFECEKLIWWEVPVMMALGSPDSVSLLFNHFNQYGIHDQEAWGRPRDQARFPGPKGFVDYVLGLHYRYLNLGLRFALTGGSASGVLQGAPGYNRVYVHADGPLTAEKWFQALKTGDSFVTNGPMLFTKFHSRGTAVDIDIDARSREPLDRIEVVANGVVVRTLQPAGDGRTLRQRVSIDARNHSWVAVRSWQKDVPSFRLAHSQPFYLHGTWDAGEDARYFRDWMDEFIAITNADSKRFRTPEEREEVLAVYRKAREVYAAKAGKAEISLRDVHPVDAHAHVFVDDPSVRSLLDRLDLRFVNVTVVDPYERGYEQEESQRKLALEVARGAAGRAPWVSTFDPKDWESPGFAGRAIRHLDETFRQGAIGVKIYKTIGMELQSRAGRYVMPDDPVFSPILDAIAARGKTLYAHIAEPIGAWKPLDPSDPDSEYYRAIPKWHMYGHPERPQKNTILAARDRMLGQHPKLRVVGCHLGSMEEDVDEIAKRLDQYPNFAVDTAARVTHLALQDREKVRAFMLRYQDRVLYGTDDALMPGDDGAAKARRWQADLERDWKFFATSDQVEYMNKAVKGLALPLPVVRKIFHENVARWVPGSVPEK